ncbi:MAG: TetM/TetW/TetO/TetS family tetracycline resistance ribosomal protection protein [Lachnospiraceae bacterium]|nr:TetM/TetW/TetO/TetS family tetracycline resistance ribosomal protection protein [Lachnospiraceae bacterium]
MKTNKYVLGILAHVDSGKTTLAESILYKSGSIRKFGRVDHKDAFLDNYDVERTRGITVFSKQAQFCIGEKEIFMLDTPGHVDFSTEMERTLQVLDYAILVISSSDGVQGHTMTLWHLLKRHHIPVFLFINKMDQTGADKNKLLDEIQNQLNPSCVDFGNCMNPDSEFFDHLAMCDENLMEEFLESDKIERKSIRDAIMQRNVFPCLFGSALKQEGVDELLELLDCFMEEKDYPEIFGARIFKISHDEINNRLTYMKITGGSLKVKSTLSGVDWSDKADQLRIYSGNQYKAVNEVCAGMICAVTGLKNTFSGEGIGFENEIEVPVLEPVLNYKLILPIECNVHEFYKKLCILGEEDPQLHIVWNEQLNEIHVQLMGEVQLEVLKSLIADRFHVEVDFGAGNIIYKETIAEPVVGIGHFEPLRHYAEVHLLMEPLERGSGLEFVSKCSEDVLDKNWQRLILTHLEEKKHIGVLTGSEITDMRISVISGRAHQKHTEGGDFRQATYRAVRNGMKKSKSILLEPVYAFRIEVQQEFVGRVMTDIQQRNGRFEPPVIESEMAVIRGTAPVICMQDYQLEINSYSHGKGKVFFTLNGYDLCHDTDEIISKSGYDSENDIDNPTGSIFCSHGAGYYIEWSKVADFAHIKDGLTNLDNTKNDTDQISQYVKKRESDFGDAFIAQEEIDEIFERTFGSAKRKRRGWGKTIASSTDKLQGSFETEKTVKNEGKDSYLLVDGYNIIFAWKELSDLAKINIDSARDKLMDIMCNYQGYKNVNLILVFDAYKVHGGQGSVLKYHNIFVVYTREAETADQYIEKVTNQIGKKHDVTVATSDRLEQMIVWGQGAKRLSANGLRDEIEQIEREIREKSEDINKNQKSNYLLDNISDDSMKVFKNMI